MLEALHPARIASNQTSDALLEWIACAETTKELIVEGVS